MAAIKIEKGTSYHNMAITLLLKNGSRKKKEHRTWNTRNDWVRKTKRLPVSEVSLRNHLLNFSHTRTPTKMHLVSQPHVSSKLKEEMSQMFH